MVHNEHCSVCDGDTSMVVEYNTVEQKDDVSFAALLALVPAMTMTLFNLMGFI